MKKYIKRLSLLTGLFSIFQLHPMEKRPLTPQIHPQQPVAQQDLKNIPTSQLRKHGKKTVEQLKAEIKQKAAQENVKIADYDYAHDYQDILKVHQVLDDTSLRYLRINKRDEIRDMVDAWFPTPEKLKEEAQKGHKIESKILRTQDGKLIGAITCTTEQRDPNDILQCSIDYVFVNPEFRGKGFGKKLIQTAIDFFNAKGCTFIDLQVVPDNPAKKLYESFGFKVETEGLGSVYMRKNLQGNQ